jgi:NDP-sugar pyrophosphorylase family protein
VEEKPTITALVNRGIYVLDPAVLAHVPSDQAFTMIELIERLQIQAAPMSVYVADDDWIDVGRPADLAKANGHMPT